MERAVPVRKPHTSTADLLTWSAAGPDAAAADGWVEELRKLRVAELRREVERYDLSIG